MRHRRHDGTLVCLGHSTRDPAKDVAHIRTSNGMVAAFYNDGSAEAFDVAPLLHQQRAEDAANAATRRAPWDAAASTAAVSGEVDADAVAAAAMGATEAAADAATTTDADGDGDGDRDRLDDATTFARARLARQRLRASMRARGADGGRETPPAEAAFSLASAGLSSSVFTRRWRRRRRAGLSQPSATARSSDPTATQATYGAPRCSPEAAAAMMVSSM